MGIVEFPTRFGLNSQMAIDNVFIDTSTITKYELYPFINGLSDHDAQLLTFKRQIKSHLPFAGIISSPYSTCFQYKG